MNFLLQNIELHIDDSFIEVAERLIEKQSVSNLYESEKNLWLAIVKEGKSYEVEIQLTAKRIKAVSCECATYKAQKICAHITSALLLVRKRYNDRAAAAKLKKPVKRNYHIPSKLTTNTILQQVSHEDLIIFVKSFARNHRNFSIALKTQFARKIDLIDNKQKYKDLLESIINAHKSVKKTVTQRGIKQVQTIIHKLLLQIDDAIALDNFSEAFAILEAIFNRFSPLLLPAEDVILDDSLAIISKCIDLVREIRSKDIAPSLREEIWHSMLEESFKSFYLHQNIETDFFKLLLEQIDDADKTNTLLEKTKVQLNRTDISQQNRVNIIGLQLSLHEKEGNMEAAEVLINENLSNPIVLLIALNQATEKNQFDRAKKLAHKGLSITDSRLIISQLEQVLLNIALQEADEDTVIKYAKSQFLYTHNLKYYDILKATKEGHPLLHQKLIEIMNKQPYSLQKRDTIAALYYQENQISQLIDYMESIGSLDLIQNYDTKLIKTHKKKIYALYEKILTTYLKNHIGRIPALRISKALQHIRNIAAHDLADRLIKQFRNNYAERHTLMEVLKHF